MNLNEFKEKGHLLIGGAGAINVMNLPGYIVYLRNNVCKNIKVILTKSAAKMVSKETVSYVSGCSTFTSEYDDIDFLAPHISLTRWADIFLVLPATANIISKAAHGIADDLLSSSILAAECPIIFYPSMNKQMWNNPAIKRSVKQLKDDDYHFKFSVEKVLEIATGNMEEAITTNLYDIESDIYSVLSQ